MIRAIIRWSVHNPSIVLLVALLVGVLGTRALKNTPVDAIPDLSDVQVIVKTSFAGQAPNIVENQVTYPLSSSLMAVPGATNVRGFSFYGDSYVYVIFEEGTDIYWARSRVLEYLNQISAQLPEGANPQLGPDASGVGWVYIYALHDQSGANDLAQLRSLQDWFLKYELQSVPGVAEVAAVGGMIKQYQVTVDPQKLQFYGIPLEHIKTAIRASNQETGISVIELAEAEYMLRATGYIADLEALRNVPLGLQYKDVPLMLHQVADVQAVAAPRRGVAELNGQGESVGGIVVMRHGENAQETIARIKQKLKELKKSLPAGVELTTVYDRSVLISSAIENLWSKVAQELLIVALVLLLFLISVRATLLALITLPLGILMSFLIMHWQGINANIMSLGGIAIAIGAMIDGAIVMVENLHRRMAAHRHSSHRQLVLDSALEVGPTLFFSLLIVTVSFLPVLALSGEEGRLFTPLVLTKTYAMASAAVLSISLVPVLLYYFVRQSKHARPAQKIALDLSDSIERLYRQSLRFCLQRPKAFFLTVLVFSLLSIYPLTQVANEFMPPLDEGDLMFMPTTHPGVSIAKARELLQQTDKLIRSMPEVQNVFGKVGRADTATDPAPLTMLETFIQLKPKSQWRKGLSTQDLIDELNQKVQILGLTNAWVMPIKTRIDMLSTGMKTPLGIKLAGPDTATLQELGEQIEALLGRLPQTLSVYSERSAGGRYLTIAVDREAAARYGLMLSDVHDWLRMAVGGAPLSQTVQGIERYAISVRFPDAYRDSPEALEDLPIITQSGRQIRLGDIARLDIVTGPALIKSENARPNTWVYLDIGLAPVSEFVAKAESLIEQNIVWPAGYSLRWSGQYQSLERVKQTLSFIIPLTLLIIAILLMLNFRRLRDVTILLASLPFAMLGGMLLIYFLEFKISVAVVVGFIALAGLSIETGALMLQVLRAQSASAGSAAATDWDRFTQAASLRLRPVIMTAVSTVAGLLPIMFGSEAGSEVMSRIAAPVVGGMLTSVILTLFVIPVCYGMLMRLEGRGWLGAE